MDITVSWEFFNLKMKSTNYMKIEILKKKPHKKLFNFSGFGKRVKFNGVLICFKLCLFCKLIESHDHFDSPRCPVSMGTLCNGYKCLTCEDET